MHDDWCHMVVLLKFWQFFVHMVAIFSLLAHMVYILALLVCARWMIILFKLSISPFVLNKNFPLSYSVLCHMLYQFYFVARKFHFKNLWFVGDKVVSMSTNCFITGIWPVFLRHCSKNWSLKARLAFSKVCSFLDILWNCNIFKVMWLHSWTIIRVTPFLLMHFVSVLNNIYKNHSLLWFIYYCFQSSNFTICKWFWFEFT